MTLRYTKGVCALALLSALATGWISYQRLHYSSDRTEMLAPDREVQRNWQAFRREFDQALDYVVLIQGSPEEARQAIEALATRLKALPDQYERIFYRIDLEQLATSALFYLSLEDLQQLTRQLRAAEPWLALLTNPKAAALAFQRISAETRPVAARQLLPALPLLTQVLTGLVESLETRGQATYHSPLPTFQPAAGLLPDGVFSPGQTRFYTTLDRGQTYMLLVCARTRLSSYGTDVASVTGLRRLIAEVHNAHPGLRFMLSGEPVINTDEMVGALRDASRSGLLSLCLVSLLLIFAFGDPRRALAVMLSLLVGLSWSCGFAALSVGSLNLLTVNFATILVGLGLTFGIHILYRFQEKRSAGRSLEESLQETLAESGRDNLVGAATTAVAFWALWFTSFRAAGELGLIAGTGVLFCFLAMVIVLPCLLIWLDRNSRSRAAIPHFAWLSQADRKIRNRPWTVLGISLALSLYSATWLDRTQFDYNVLNMQPENSEAVRVEHYLQSAGYSALFAVSISADLKQARLQNARFSRLPSVARVESVASFEPVEVAAKLPWVEKVLGSARAMVAPPAVPAALTVTQLLSLYRTASLAEKELRKILPSLPKDQGRALGALLNRLDQSVSIFNPGPAEVGLISYANRLRTDLATQLGFLHAQTAVPPPGLEQLPAELRVRSLSQSGKVVSRIFPRHDCWEREPLEQFIRQLRRVDGQVTGSPVLIYEYLQDLRSAYSVSARNALLVIFVLLLLHFRSLAKALLAISPKLLGLLWMIGVMGYLGESFNPANSMALPLTLGIGLIFGVQVLQHYLQPEHGSLFQDSTGPAIVTSSLASVLGFSTLLLAEHRGVASFGVVMTIGVIATLLASLITLPALIQVLPLNHGGDGKSGGCGQSSD